jgi:hypothetical protein
MVERERPGRRALLHIDLRQRPVVEVPDPDCACPNGDRPGADANLDLVDDVVGCWVDDSDVVGIDVAEPAP